MSGMIILFCVVLTALGQSPDDIHVSARDCEARRAPLLRPECPFDSLHSFDVTHYRISLTVDTLTEMVSGNTSITGFVLDSSLSDVELDLSGLVIDSVYANGQRATFFTVGAHITVFLAETLFALDTFSVQVFHWGYPVPFLFADGAFFALSQPEWSKWWFPCYDQPFDKADSTDLILTVPYGSYLVSNGALVESLDTGDGISYHWHSSYPISTYLISVAGARYTKWNEWYHSASGDSMPVLYYVLPEESVSAAYDFENTVDMISFFAEIFGEYPFLSEKYAMASIPARVAMEHQTCTSYGSPYITGDKTYEVIVSHELAHQWWGDWVTLGTWKDIWLNEGFATYSEALYRQHRYGEAAFRDRMSTAAGWFFREDSTMRYAIYDPPSGYLFGSAVYHKGAWVLHMLRSIVGDSAFFDVLRAYGKKFGYWNAVTTDFTAVADSVTISQLNWFFDEWIYEPGYPEYLYWWSVDSLGPSQFLVHLSVTQVQSNAPVYRMPIEMQLDFGSGDTTIVVVDSLADQRLDLAVSRKPVAVLFDPNEKILKRVEETVPYVEEDRHLGRTSPLRVFPNPSCRRRHVSFEAGVQYQEHFAEVSLTILDVTGRILKSFLVEDASQGLRVQWDLRDEKSRPVPSGVYFCRLSAGEFVETRKMVVLD